MTNTEVGAEKKQLKSKTDKLYLPELAYTELVTLYNKKYAGIPGNHKKRLNSNRLALHIIFQTHKDNRLSQESWFPLSTEILKLYLGKNKKQGYYATVLSDLKEWGYIEIDESYRFNSARDLRNGIVKDTYCRSYRLTVKLINDKWSWVEVAGLHYAERTKKGKQQRKEKIKASIIAKEEAIYTNMDKKLKIEVQTPVVEQQEHYDLLKQNLSRIYLNEKDALAWIDKAEKEYANPQYSWVLTGGYEGYVKQINDHISKEEADNLRAVVQNFNLQYKAKNTPFSVTETNGRLNSALTNLPSKLREFVEVEGMKAKAPLWYYDLKASQPFILLKYLQKTVAIRANYDGEFTRFTDLVLSDKFYELLWLELKAINPELTIKESYKEAFFTFVLYSNNDRAYGYRKAFNTLFPTVNNAILEVLSSIKDTGENLAVHMQKEESRIFLDRICPEIQAKLGKTYFLATIHDGIIVQGDKSLDAKDIMKEVIKEEIGFKPQIKTEKFNKKRLTRVVYIP